MANLLAQLAYLHQVVIPSAIELHKLDAAEKHFQNYMAVIMEDRRVESDALKPQVLTDEK